MVDFEHLNEDQLKQVEASLTRAVDGTICMHAKCPACERARCLFERILPGGFVRHRCKSCGYFMIWSPRESWNANKKKEAFEYEKTVFGPGGANPDRRDGVV